MDSELVDIADWKCELVLKQKVYFRLKIPEDINAKNKLSMSKNEKRIFLRNIMIYLSTDAKRWVPYTDIRAAEKAFGIKGGSISFGMGITKQDGINIFLNAKTNRDQKYFSKRIFGEYIWHLNLWDNNHLNRLSEALNPFLKK